MSDYDNGFSKAQCDYENQLPPESNIEECSKCEGAGNLELSDCCGESIEHSDNGTWCTKCGEDCILEQCDQCNGTGIIDHDKEKQEMSEEEMERKADEQRYEKGME